GDGRVRVEHADEPRGARRGGRSRELPHTPPTGRVVREAQVVRQRSDARGSGPRALPERASAEEAVGGVREPLNGTTVRRAVTPLRAPATPCRPSALRERSGGSPSPAR